MATAYRNPTQDSQAELLRAKRLLMGVSIIAVGLLGPVFIVGYLTGYRTGRAGGPANPATAVEEPAAKELAGKEKATETAAVVHADQRVGGRQRYLQLAAAEQDRSTEIVGQLRSSGFPVLTSAIPEKPGLFRVLVGPLRSDDLGRIRADLQSKGFPGNSAIVKTF